MPKYSDLREAIRRARAEISWRPGSAERHLRKRKLRGHLPSTATLEDYEHIILAVLDDSSAQVYRYWYNRVSYVAMVAAIGDQTWLVMFDYNAVLESAFVVEHPERYLKKPGFEWIGLLREVDRDEV